MTFLNAHKVFQCHTERESGGVRSIDGTSIQSLRAAAWSLFELAFCRTSKTCAILHTGSGDVLINHEEDLSSVLPLTVKAPDLISNEVTEPKQLRFDAQSSLL